MFSAITVDGSKLYFDAYMLDDEADGGAKRIDSFAPSKSEKDVPGIPEKPEKPGLPDLPDLPELPEIPVCPIGRKAREAEEPSDPSNPGEPLSILRSREPDSPLDEARDQ